MEIDRGIISVLCFPLPLIQERQLSVTGKPASVAQVDANLAGDQEVVGSTLMRRQHSLVVI